MTNVELDLLTDLEQHLFFKEKVRERVVMITHQHTWANAPDMSLPLPTSNFKWLKEEEREELDVMMVPDDSSRGYILECDLGNYYFYYLNIYVYFLKCNVSSLCISEYPRDFIKWGISFLCISEYPHEIHDLYKDYPLAPERFQIEENIFSNYQRHLLQDKRFSKPPPKLVRNLCHKTNYIIHYRNLKLCLELGLCLTNVHRVLLFDQSPWLKNYINFNICQRTAAKHDFEKDFCKLMNNVVFGNFLCLFVLLCSYVLIHSLIHSLQVNK